MTEEKKSTLSVALELASRFPRTIAFLAGLATGYTGNSELVRALAADLTALVI